MGMLMHFFAGNAAEIGVALAVQQDSLLRDPAIVLAEADWSLHLSPIDLDLFSLAACSLAGLPPISLSDSLLESVAGDGEQSSADVVSSEWVEMLASVPESQIGPLASLWMENVAQEYSEEAAAPTPESLRAIAELIHVCQTALDRKVAVVHTWSL